MKRWTLRSAWWVAAALVGGCVGSIGGQATGENGPGATGPGGSPTEASVGLYETHCSACHGALVTSTLLPFDLDSERVHHAIANVPPMAHLAVLTDAEVAQIVSAVRAQQQARVQVCEQQETLPEGRLFRLTKEQYGRVVQDLTGLDDASPYLQDWPSEAVQGSFQTAGLALEAQPALLASLLTASEAIVDAVWTDPAILASALGCDSAETGCAERAIERWVTRGFKRAVEPEVQERLQSVYRTLRAGSASDEEALKVTLQAVLVSPSFLFAAYVDGTDTPDGGLRLSGRALAHRLAMVVWGGLPDDALLQAADQGDLFDEEGLSRQLARMLRDPRAQFLAEQYLEAWLVPTRFEGEASVYSELEDAGLQSALRGETRRFLEELVAQDRPLTDVVRSDAAFRNEQLSAHYGDAAVSGDSLEAVVGSPVGVLAHGSILSLTGRSTEALNVIHRGNWALRTLVCEAPPPPADLDAVREATEQDLAAGATTRELSEARIESAACSTCHSNMDAVGFAFEEYDSLGRFRDGPIDDVGELPDGSLVQGTEGLSDWLLSQDAAQRCFAQHFASYAYQRVLAMEDYCVANRIGQERWDAPLSSWLAGVALSRGFTEVR